MAAIRPLGSLEERVMELVWRAGTLAVRDAVRELGGQLAYTTVMTIMSRLHAKGLLERVREGKTYVYRPAFSREEHRERISRELVRDMVREFGDVALAQFAAELDGVDVSHRAALKRMAAKDMPRAPR